MILWALAAAAFGGPDCVGLDGSALEGRAGSRKMALIVGVGDYKAEPGGESIDLKGPPQDALRMRELLMERYGFPASNVCLLRDSEATRANYVRGWRDHLGRASSGDTVVYYFAGHGSQTKDFDGGTDETDGMDETILLHDSRTSGVEDLVDDEFNTLLGELYQKTENITVIVDACNSGTTTRGVDLPPSDFVERKVEPMERQPRRAPGDRLASGSGDYTPQRLPGIVVVTAAQDGTSALERNGQGVFTNALLRSLDTKGDGSWEQITQVLPRWVAAQKSYQRPTFEGRLDRAIFGSAVVDRGMSWQVVKVSGDNVQFRGPAMPGWTDGAVLEVFEDGGRKRKAKVRISEVSSLDARGSVIAGRGSIAPGDYAVLTAPGPESVSIRVQISNEIDMASDIKKALRQDDVLSRTVEVVDGAADFYVRPVKGSAGVVDIVGDEGVRRNRLALRNKDDAQNVSYSLGLHARQASLLALSGEPNEVYPHDLLDLRVVPIPSAPEGCARTPFKAAAAAVPYVQVPICNSMQVEVSLKRAPRDKLYLGILYLANDGSITVWPRGLTTEVLERVGDRYIEKLGWASPPLDAFDRIVVFGSHEPVVWSRLAQKALPSAATRGTGDDGPSLDAFINSHVGGTRGIQDDDPSESGNTAWTSAFVQVQVVADPAKWTDADRNNPNVCKELRQRQCR